MYVMENIKAVLSRNIKDRRKHLKMNQERLSEITGLSISFIKNIERGVSWPSPESMEVLAKCLDISIGGLLNNSMAKERPEEPQTIKHFLNKASAIPDEVYDLAPSIPKDHATWKDIINQLKEAKKSLADKKSNHS